MSVCGGGGGGGVGGVGTQKLSPKYCLSHCSKTISHHLQTIARINGIYNFICIFLFMSSLQTTIPNHISK